RARDCPRSRGSYPRLPRPGSVPGLRTPSDSRSVQRLGDFAGSGTRPSSARLGVTNGSSTILSAPTPVAERAWPMGSHPHPQPPAPPAGISLRPSRCGQEFLHARRLLRPGAVVLSEEQRRTPPRRTDRRRTQMTVLMIAEQPNMDEGTYALMLEPLMPLLRSATGFISHAGGPSPVGGMRIIEIWESEADQRKFFDENLKANLPP